MEKRTLLAVALAIIVLVLYHYLVPTPKPPQIEKEKKEEVVKEKETPSKDKAPVKEKKPVSLGVVEEKLIHIETELYKAVLTNKGAAIKSWELKKYTDNDKKPVQLLRTEDPSVLPLSIFPGPSLEQGEGILKGNYKVDKEKVILSKDMEKETISFFYQDRTGVSVKKTLAFYSKDYRVDIKIETEGINSYTLSLGQDFGIFKKDEGYGHVGPVTRVNSDNITNKPEKIKEPLIYKGSIAWTAMEDKYFTAAVAPVSKVDEAVVNRIGDSATTGLTTSLGVSEFILYAGPKEYDRLKTLKVGLEDIIDYGWFPLGSSGNKVLALPFFRLLKLFYNFLKNYGLAIILLTVLVRIVFIPLTNKSQKSMKAMQSLAPKVNEIKEKYKKDPQRMNKEVMELYKKHKINPVGGCLPMILQLPVFIALYNVLMYAIELRGAPFFLWVTDLSAPDTLFGHVGGFSLGGPLPYLMGITMFVQQKMTPSSLDPMQSKMMLFMPVVLTFMFLSFPSGLVLYWLVNNVLSIAQQYYINKKTA